MKQPQKYSPEKIQSLVPDTTNFLEDQIRRRKATLDRIEEVIEEQRSQDSKKLSMMLRRQKDSSPTKSRNIPLTQL